MQKLALFGILLLLFFHSTGQNINTLYFQGFSEEVSGKRFGYHSPFPDVTNCLLLRGQDDYEPVVWKSEIVPDNYADEIISFIWVFGMDVTSNPVDFTLSINNTPLFEFSSSSSSDLGIRTIPGKVENSELTLNVTMLDKYEDQMGFAIVKLPIELITKGKSAEFKVSTITSDNNSWYMTFCTEVQNSIDIYQNKVVAKKDGNLYHSISVDFVHIGDKSNAEVRVGSISENLILNAGFNKLEMYLPKVDTITDFIGNVNIAGLSYNIPFALEPVREWEIFLVQHTHTDIGYTRPQTEILPEHLRYIDNALDFCDQTDNYPDDAKFRWTCETSWSVREYLNSRPQVQIDRLLARVREGRIEATGMFLNYSEIIDESALAEQTRTLSMLKSRGVDVTTAMQNDVNGIAWCLVDYYHNTDVKYLTMGIHAHRARKPFNKPTSFWWQSPAGNRLLAYRSEHYQHGNSLSLTTGQQDVFRNNLSDYLTSLEEKGYPYDKISLQFSGYVTDNSPPSTKVCDIIKEWNDKYEWPKLRSSLARDFMIYLDEYHSEDIPVQEVAWPDWWTDGVASAANETKVVRNTQSKMTAITTLMSMARIMGVELPDGINNEVQDVYDNLLFYDEHTHGAAESVSDPLAQNTINQWAMKSAYAWEASKKAHSLEEKIMAFIEPSFRNSKNPQIVVFNTLNWERSSLVNLFILRDIIPDGEEFTITDSNGKEVPYQEYDQRMEGSYYGLWVENVPPLGYKILNVNIGEESKLLLNGSQSATENKYYKITINNPEGVIASIFDKQLDIELLNTDDTLSLGDIIYEQLENRHELERLTASNRDTIYKPLKLKRTLPTNLQVTGTKSGHIYNSVFLNGLLPVCADSRGVTIEIRLFNHEKKLELQYSMFKLPVTEPEGVYVSFPFNLKDGFLAFEAQGGIVFPGVNQLEGSSSDWNTIQNFASVRNKESQIVFSSNDIPLVQFGDINTGRYYYKLVPKTNSIFSWVLNNYWVTNFKASQQGELRWKYSLTSSDDKSDTFSTRFGWGESVPMLSRIVMPSVVKENKTKESRSLLELKSQNLLLVRSYPSIDGKGIIIQLREIEGDHAIIDSYRILEETGASSMQEVNILEEEIRNITSPVLIEHFETKFIKLNF